MEIKKWLANPENTQKVEDGIARKKEERLNYDPEVWVKAKRKFDNIKFPQDHFNRFASKQNVGNYHTAKKARHALRTFKWAKGSIDGFSMEFLISRCDKCDKDVIKKAVLSNDMESSAYIRSFTSKSRGLGDL